MAQHASPIVAMPQTAQPEQAPLRSQPTPDPQPDSAPQPALEPQPTLGSQPVPAHLPAPADPSPNPSLAGLGGNRLRPLEVAECSLCGVARPLGLLVPDGGSACDGVRWYCKDVRSCTERWVAARQSGPARQPSPFGRALAAAPPPAPARIPADAPEEPRSIASLAPASGVAGYRSWRCNQGICA